MLVGDCCRLIEQIQMLSPANRVAIRDRRSRIVLRMRARRPSREYQDDQRQRKNHREPKCETVWFLCHVCLWPPECRGRRPTLRTEISRDALNCVTLARNGRSPMQPHSFSRQMSAWDETGAGLFGEALRTYIPAAS